MSIETVDTIRVRVRVLDQPHHVRVSTRGVQGIPGPQGEPGVPGLQSGLLTSDPDVQVSTIEAPPPLPGMVLTSSDPGHAYWAAPGALESVGLIQTADPARPVDFGAADPPTTVGEIPITATSDGEIVWESLADILPTPLPTPPPSREGDALGTGDGSGRQGVVVLGADADRTARIISTDAAGQLQVAGLAGIASSLSAVTTSLADLLAAQGDAATQTTLEQARTVLQQISTQLSAPLHVVVDNSIEVDTSELARETTLADAAASLSTIAGRTTQPVSLTTVPLATDAATASGVAAVRTSVDALTAHVPQLAVAPDTGLRVHVENTVPIDTSALASESTLSSLSAKVPSLSATAGSLHVTVDSEPHLSSATDSVAVTGTVAVSGTTAVSSTQLPAALVSGRLPVDGSGVTQPISGSVSVSGTPNVAVTSLPASAATETTLSGRLSETTFTTRTPTVGAKTSAASSPVVLATDQASIPVAATIQGTPSVSITGTPAVSSAQLPAALVSGRLSVDGSSVTQPVSGSVSISGTPAVTVSGVATESTLAGRLSESTFTTRTPTVGAKTSAASSPVVIASDQASIPVAATISGTPSVTISGTPAVTLSGTSAVSTTQLPAALVSGRLSVDGSAVTQPVSGSVSITGTPAVTISGIPAVSLTSTTITSSALPTGAATDAVLTGGAQQAQIRSGTKGTSTGALVTSTAEGANNQALDVQLYHGGAAINPTATRALTAADVVTAQQGGAPWSTTISGTPSVSISGTPAVTLASTTITGSVAVTSASLATDAVLTGGTQRSRITDGTNNAPLKVSTAAVAADPALPVTISPSSASLPVTLASTTITGTVTTTGTSTVSGTVAVSGTTAVSSTQLPSALVSNRLAVDGSGVTQPVSGSVSITGTPAVTLASTTITGSVNTRALTTSDQVAVAYMTSALGAKSVANSLSVTIADSSVPVSGSVSATITGTPSVSATITGTPAVSLASTTITSSALPTGAAQDTTLSNGTQRTRITDAAANQLGLKVSAAAVAADPAIPVTIHPSTSHMPVAFTTAALGSKTVANSLSVTVADSSLAVTSAQLPAALVSNRLAVDGSGVTQPISGTVTVTGTTAVSAVSLPLPTGAAQDTTLTGGSQIAQLRSGAKGAVGAALVTSSSQTADRQALDVTLWSSGSAVTPAGAAQLPSTLGAKASTASLSITPATDALHRVGDGASSITLKTSAAAVASDPALVVTIAPNSDLPAYAPRGFCDSATAASVAINTTSSTIIAAYFARRGFSIHNAGPATAYIRCGSASATTSVYTALLTAGSAWVWEAPVCYLGAVQAITASGTATLMITEYS